MAPAGRELQASLEEGSGESAAEAEEEEDEDEEIRGNRGPPGPSGSLHLPERFLLHDFQSSLRPLLRGHGRYQKGNEQRQMDLLRHRLHVRLGVLPGLPDLPAGSMALCGSFLRHRAGHCPIAPAGARLPGGKETLYSLQITSKPTP